VEVGVEEGADVGSLHPPKKPWEWHVVEELVGDVTVTVGFGALLVLVVVSSLHPNHPGVLQVEVDVVLLLVDVPEVVVLSSKHPHHPGF